MLKKTKGGVEGKMKIKLTSEKLGGKESKGTFVGFSLFKPLIKLEVPFRPPQNF